LHGKLRHLGETVKGSQPLTVCLFLDGENAWEYYAGNGREFLREFYGRIQRDQDFLALTATGAIAVAGDIPNSGGIFPGSWINANFDVWIGHAEDVAAWELLWDAREAFAQAQAAREKNRDSAPTAEALAAAKESLLAAEGSDWTWWYGPEHSSANDAEFDALFRKHLTAIYRALGLDAPDDLAKPIKRKPDHAFQIAPSGFLQIKVDGRNTSYFEWLGAGLYSPERRGGAMHGRTYYLHELRYGFESNRFCVRIDAFPESLAELENPEFRITISGDEEVAIVLRMHRRHLVEFSLEKGTVCLMNPETAAEAAFDGILELCVQKELIGIKGKTSLRLGVALWHCGLPVDVLPAEGWLDVALGEENFGWALEK
jgi:hypothetical protein